MKKIWNLMLVALVMLGAAACTEKDVNVDANENAGFSFYAEVAEATRATIEKDGDVWKTAWELNDKLYVIAGDAGEYRYEFSCTDVETGKFTCTDNTVAQHVGQPVSIRTAGDHYSLEGKSAFYTTVNVNAFGADAKIELPALTSFFRYTYNGEGDVKLALTADAFRNEDGTSAMEVVVAGKSGENFVAFWPGLDGLTATLTFAVNGMTIKEKELTFAAGMVYNLGTMTLPYEASAYSVVGTHNNWTAGKTPMYKVGDYCVAYGVTFGAAENAFKVLGNDKWYGAAGLTLGTWTSVSATDSPDITIAAGTYDIYFSEADSKVCVVAAGAEVPAMPVFSIGVVGLGGNWDVDKDMTLEGDYYTLKGVAIAATDTFKLRISDAWAENYGIASSDAADYVAINVDAMYTLVQDGKNMQVSAGTYDLYFNYNTKEFYVLTAGTTPEDLAIPQYKVYVYNYKTTWSDIYLYMWDENETYIFGEWPGSTTTSKETINGHEYMVWTMPRSATGKSVNIILNNNNGAQTADYSLGTIDENKYVILNNGIVDAIEDINNPEPVVPTTTYKIYVYKHNNNWSKVNLYTWDATNNATYTGVWPGSTTSVTEVINGYTYYVWEMPGSATGRKIRMIFNYGSAQTGDSDPYTLDKDLYIRLNGAAIQDIEDKNNPEPTAVAQPRKIYATTTLSWSKMNIYAWGGGASFGWPGTQMSTETINGTKYYVYTFDASFDGVTLTGVIFNNGSAQTVDIKNVKLDQDRFFRVLTSQSGGKYKYEAIADPR